jgi:hypothetical protein
MFTIYHSVEVSAGEEVGASTVELKGVCCCYGGEAKRR